MKTYKIHFIRHGQTDGNKQGRFVGSTDVSINEEGKENLMILLDRFGYPTVGRLYTSPLKRCRETASILYPEHPQIVLDDLREYNFGDFENKTYAELAGNPEFDKWVQTATVGSIPNGEDGHSFVERCRKGFEGLLMDMMKGGITSAACITHGGIIMTLMALFDCEQLPKTAYMVDNGTGFTVLLTPSLWMRSQIFEIYSRIPNPQGEGFSLEKYFTAKHNEIH